MDRTALKAMLEDLEVHTSGTHACDIALRVSFVEHLKTASKIAAVHAMIAEVMGSPGADATFQSARTEGATAIFTRHPNVTPQDAKDLVAAVADGLLPEKVVFVDHEFKSAAKSVGARVIVKGSTVRVERREEMMHPWHSKVSDGFQVDVLKAAVLRLFQGEAWSARKK